ncbi:SRPBCC family protein [Mycobacterium celatum]|uniref:Polyketide cyclase n=1 Tax=Mycobacterium celatum TaxID=28045 RepID=A0A1X1RIV7_MYCCE|nr:SRPBCC family protein [Mycobacterium celatum]ORV07004.1 polyketide cyclase [Mycobacterium celatum]PIB78183.1 polyketide cyclase [Mycobacterium celatum]
MRYVREETVHAPAQRVWQLLVDVAGWPNWTESMREITRLDDGPLAVGSRSRVTQPKGRPMVWTVTELEPLRNFTWVTRRPGLSFEALHLIEDTGDHVRTRLEFVATGPLAWLASLLGGSRVRTYVDMESAGLKRAAEAG